jgi:glycosyltransferase involved in cell wall biosynthesis
MKNKTADITVIIPYYNEENNILTTLSLVSTQSLMPREVILVNSSSSDYTSNIINKWISKNKRRFNTTFRNLFDGTNNPACSKNLGILNTQTTWVAFMDCGLIFPDNWLELQFHFVQINKLTVVSGVVKLKGENSIDRAAVAQTYGYQMKRVCVPSTLVKKDVFEKTGLFLKGRRAGYDVAWPLMLRHLGVARGVNEDVLVTYQGVNFGSHLQSVFKKSLRYSIPSVGIKLYWIPYYYLIILFFIIAINLIFPSIIFPSMIIFGYIILRGFVIPIIKGQYINLIKEDISQLWWLLIVGMVLDFGRTIGATIGFLKYHLGIDVYSEK